MSRENSALEVEDEEFVDELKPDTKLMLGQYTIEDFLAAGGFGITYLAKDSLGRRVVIKECFPGSFCRRQNHSVTPRSRAHQNELKSIVRLFSQEAMSLAKANHPNIVGVHQVFEENNTAYMALDYVQGRDLLEILHEDPDSLKPGLVEGYLVKILDAIGHIHNLGMLHRDISPDNIIINEQGEPILIDFGAARESTNERVTRMLSALRVVKDGYSPQEFYIAGSDQTPSCDLYSLAASFYHIITRELPPDSQWRLSACAAGDDDPYVSLSEKAEGYSKRFVSALDKAMSILPRDRMQSAEEWLAHIDGDAEVQAVTSSVVPASASATEETSGKTPFMPILLGTTAVAAALGAGFFLLNGGDNAAPSGVTDQPDALAGVEAPAPTIATQDTSDTGTPTTESTAALSNETAQTPPAGTTFGANQASDADGTASQPSIAESQPATDATAVVEPVADAEPEVAIAVSEPPLPAVEETTDFVVPPIIAALPQTTVVPLPRPLREVDAAIVEEQPNIETTAPAALPQETVQPPVEAPAEPSVVAANEPTQEAGSGETGNSSLEFFMSMSTSEPDLVSAARSARSEPVPPTVAEETAAPAPATDAAPRDEESESIITQYIPVVPFTLSPWNQGMVISADENAPAWLTQNSRIVSVAGEPATSNDDILSKIASAAPEGGAESFDVTIGIDAGLNTAVVERTLTVSNEQHTLLLNGLQFVAREQGSAWVTQVVNAPANSSFRSGDTLVSYVSTWEDLDGPNSLQTILNRELADGTTSFSFAVSRGGEIWIEAFNLASVSN